MVVNIDIIKMDVTRVVSNKPVTQLVLGFIGFQRLPKHGQQTGEESSECRIEDQVEQKNFRCE